jgi:hypothetical protein
MTLKALQSRFRDFIAAPDAASTPSFSGPGMAIYRDAYRGRLLAALEASFPRTRRWVGSDPFQAAATHYILMRPPTSWTLDNYGSDFPALLAQLFAEDPEVGDLAWLEWAMAQAFAAPDGPILGFEALAAANYQGTDWDHVAFTPASGVSMRWVATPCTDLWVSLDDDDSAALAPHMPRSPLIEPHLALVWRKDVTAHYRLVAPDEAHALAGLIAGACLGRVAQSATADTLGHRLVKWLSDGLFADHQLRPPPRGAADPGSALA